MTAQRVFTEIELAELDSEAYYAAAEALEAAEKAAKAKGITRADIARALGMDKGSVTRVLGGSQRNITLKTLFSLMKAMNRKVFITSCDIEDLPCRKPNFSFDAQTFERPIVFSGQTKNQTNTATNFIRFGTN